MLGTIRSEIYKLFNKKSFYVCALILMALAGISVWGYKELLASQYRISSDFLNLKEMGFTGWDGIKIGVGNVLIINSIFTSIFVSYEFSSGMNKNLAIRGKNRFVMYFSKMIVSMLIPVLYTLLSALTSYAIASHLWNTSSWDQKYIDSIIIPIGVFVLVQMAYQSIFVMVGYLSKSSGWATAINFALSSAILTTLIIGGIDHVLNSWFGIEESVFKYWIGRFSSVYYEYPLKDEIAKVFPWVVSSYFVVPAIIGSFVFWKREIK